MVAWLDRLTNLASSVRTEVCSPESSHERYDATRFVGMGSRTRTQRCPGRRGIRSKLTETPNTDPCTQAPVSWRNADNPSTWIGKHCAVRRDLCARLVQFDAISFCRPCGRTGVERNPSGGLARGVLGASSTRSVVLRSATQGRAAIAMLGVLSQRRIPTKNLHQ